MMGLDGGRRLFEQETSRAGNIGGTLARFAGYFRRTWVGVVVALVLITIQVWTQVVTPDYIGQAVDCYLFPQPASVCWFDPTVAEAMQNGTMDTITNEMKLAGLGQIALLLLGLFVFGSVLAGLAFYSMSSSGQRVLKQLRNDLFNKLQRLSLSFYAENEVGNLMSRITSDTETIAQTFGFALLQVVSGALLMVWLIVKMLGTNVAYSLVSLAVVPIMFVATVWISNQARRAFRRSRRQMGSVNAELQESIAGAREVQAFNREEETIEEFRRVNQANRAANIQAAAFTAALNPVLEALGYVALGVVVIVGGLSILGDEPVLGISGISLGVVFTFIQYVQRFNQPITQIAVLWTNIQSAIAGGERIFGLLDEPIEIQDKPGAKPIPQITGRVEFDNVHAGYKADEPVLKDVSFTAEPGQTVAIVGPTGAGKTTIINLIPRFYDVSGGGVRIDGHDVRDVTMESLRQQIGIVLQDSFLFSDTVLENIRYGRMDATDEEVIAAAKLVNADVFIERLPDGYKTVLGERGSGLSQGQRQLLSIARVVLKDPRILILDEATSSIDTRTERLIQKAFEHILPGRTAFVIAHRLSTIRNADVVMMLKDGQIIERGTHRSLIEKRGAYYDLYMSQYRHEDQLEATSSTNGSQPTAVPSGD
ncbi:MAG: ABC transporter ATP-binding protein [Chloroflexi bacterium]|nr:ABC transporter ATP-binding protein [Chloroflexota bacterium]